MSKDCKKSYEEVHKKLGEELEKAYLKRETPEEKIPEFDLSFLEEQPYEPTEENDAAREESFISPKEEKKRRFSRFAKIAAVLIIFLLCTNIIMLGRDSSESYGDKGILHRLYQGVTGLFTDSEEETEESDVEETVTVLDEKDIDSAKEFYRDFMYRRISRMGMSLKSWKYRSIIQVIHSVIMYTVKEKIN